MWEVSKEVFFNFLWGFAVASLVCWLTSIILSALFKEVWQSFLSGTSTVVRFGILILFLSLAVSSSFLTHYFLDYPLSSTGTTVMEVIQNPDQPLDPPLELNLCEGEWYPGCAYD